MTSRTKKNKNKKEAKRASRNRATFLPISIFEKWRKMSDVNFYAFPYVFYILTSKKQFIEFLYPTFLKCRHRFA